MSEKFHKNKQQAIDFNINDSEYDMLVDQLVFDILRNYYEENVPKITRFDFANQIAPLIYKNNSEVFVLPTYANRINQRMINTMKSYYTNFKNTITINHLVMPDIDSLFYVSHLITPKNNKKTELDLNSIHSFLIENQVLSKYPGYKAEIYKYIQNMSVVSITTKNIISLLRQIDITDDSHEKITVKYVTDNLDQLNKPVEKYINPYKERSFASWLGFFFDNTFIPKELLKNEFTINNDSELISIIDSLSKYEAAIKSLRPSTDIDTPIKIFKKSIELYSIIFHKGIEIILDYYMSTMDLVHLENDKKDIIMKAFSKWIDPGSTLVSTIDLDNENNQYFGSYEISFSPMIFIEQKLYRKALEDIISKNNSDNLERILLYYSDYIQAIHLVRFKTLELFRYHARFSPKPKTKCYSIAVRDEQKYSQIEDFLLGNYNLRKYSDEIWKKANKIKAENH